MKDLKFARLSQTDIERIRAFEKTLEADVCLVAVEHHSALYVLEAKMSPSEWRRVDRVYPSIEGIQAYFSDPDNARAAKAGLKSFLLSRKAEDLVKRPIRIRLSVPVADEEE
ncbi:MAG: hypothetical protein ACOWWM_01210 [Desulfobacterales bacterium]